MYSVPSLSRRQRLFPALGSALFGLWAGWGRTFDFGIFSNMTAGVFVRKALVFSGFVAVMIMIFRRGPGMRPAGEPLFTRRMQLMIVGAPILNVALQLAARPLLALIETPGEANLY